MEWQDSGVAYTEINVVQPGSATPYVTVSREIQADPAARKKHVHTRWWDGSEWKTLEVVRGLNQPAHATAEARMQAGVTHDLVHAWRDGHSVWWRSMDPATHTMVGGFGSFNSIRREYPVGLDIHSSGHPAFTYFDDPAGPPPAGIYYQRWNGGAMVDRQLLTSCADDFTTTPLHLRSNDRFVIACETPIVGGDREITVGEDVGGGVYVETTVFGAADTDDWNRPDLAIAGDIVVVAAVNQTDNEVWARIKVGAGAWQAPVRLVDFAPADPAISSLALAAHLDTSGLTYGVHVKTSHRLYHNRAHDDLSGSLSVGETTRVDLYEEGFGATCDELVADVDLHLPNADDVWLNWFVDHQNGSRDHIISSRFTAFRSEDQRTFANANNLSLMPFRPTTLALSEDGDNWRCFYDEDPGGTPKIAVYIQYRDDAPILVEGDTGAVANSYARGCDIAVDDDGDVHVVWGNATNNTLRSTYYDGVGFSAKLDLTDTHGLIPATGYVAMTVSHDGRTSTVYQRPVSGNLRACVLDTVDQLFYTTTCFPQNGGGAYPDITQLGSYGYVRALIYGAGNDIHVAITNGYPGGWSDEFVTNEGAYDFSIAGRTVGADSRLVAAWARGGAGQGVRLAERVEVPQPPLPPLIAWDLSTVEAGSVEFTNVELDGAGDAALTWHLNQAGADVLRIGTWEKWADGRDPNIDPEPLGRYVKCDLAEGEYGNALELDAHGNVRVSHRSDGKATTLPINNLYYISRP